MRAPMRSILVLLTTAVLSFPACSGETDEADARKWFDVAADAQAGTRRREYAAQRLVMLADSSASILVAELDNRESGLGRQVAATLLGEIAPPEAENALLRAALDEDYFLARAARAALARLYARLSDADIYSLLTRGARERYTIPGGVAADGGEEDWLALSLQLAKNRGGFKALVMSGLALKRRAAPEPLPEPLRWQVWEGLLDGDVDLRLAAVAVVPEAASPEATERLAALLYVENDVRVLTAALRAMARMRPPAYGEAVERHAGHADPLVAIEALAALAEMGYPLAMFPPAPGGRAVASYVPHPSTPVRRRAIELLAESRNPAALPYLETALTDRVGANRAMAARALGEMGLTAAVGVLTPMLGDGRPEARREAAAALSRLGVVGVASGVLGDLAATEPMPFRIAAAEALGRIGDARAVPGLLAALMTTRDVRPGEDGDELRFAVMEALGRLRDPSAGPALYSFMIRQGDDVASGYAREALREIFQDDPGDSRDDWPAWATKNGVAH